MPVRTRDTNLTYHISAQSAPSDLRVSLTDNEKRILTAVAHFGQTRTAAQRLGLSEHTVKNRLNLIYKKLQVPCRTGAVLRAVQLGLITV